MARLLHPAEPEPTVPDCSLCGRALMREPGDACWQCPQHGPCRDDGTFPTTTSAELERQLRELDEPPANYLPPRTRRRGPTEVDVLRPDPRRLDPLALQRSARRGRVDWRNDD